MSRFYIQIYRHTPSALAEGGWVDVSSLGIHPDTADLLAEMGILEVRMGCVPADQVNRLQKILRIRKNLGVNLPGAAIIVELLHRVEILQEEIERLKRG
ncbi:MAG: chaperone modulator CbpM [Bacillota bacterium]